MRGLDKPFIDWKKILSGPSTLPEKSPFSGRTFIRDWGKRCPSCQDIFFARRLETEFHEPYRVDLEPDHSIHGPVMRVRETCGHPMCQEVEELHQLERTPYWQAARNAAFPAPVEPTHEPKKRSRV